MAVTQESQSLLRIVVAASAVGTLKDQIYVGTKRKMLVWIKTLAAGAQQLDVKIHRVQPESTSTPVSGEKVQLGSTLTASGNGFTSGAFGEGAAVPPDQFISQQIEIEQIRTVVGAMDYTIWIELRD